ncbi:uncharacterized protein EV422DRAFT_615340 [Fimicolochytrium jonesii]|uniref:uncharacterized protein n=1 Tax=Fimicolochytrium jonesii TaxID=1396493 RepID=UPI0022FF28F4|nr:uncharacterized protein EV422DRAFT_615340 [Fimicolochytrium jonesii]KAI8821864.1 hypothetical protein EV422DRAFT_615340 [Fimicolochytrium jonesii]
MIASVPPPPQEYAIRRRRGFCWPPAEAKMAIKCFVSFALVVIGFVLQSLEFHTLLPRAMVTSTACVASNVVQSTFALKTRWAEPTKCRHQPLPYRTLPMEPRHIPFGPSNPVNELHVHRIISRCNSKTQKAKICRRCIECIRQTERSKRRIKYNKPKTRLASGMEYAKWYIADSDIACTAFGLCRTGGKAKVYMSGVQTNGVMLRADWVGALVRRHLENQGLSAAAAELASTAYKTSTNHKEQLSWKYFSMWCTERRLDPICATDLDVVNYLDSLHHNGKSVKVIESARSAITSTLTLLSPNRSFHRSYLAQSIVKAMHLRTGPRKKAYTTIWNPATLHLANLHHDLRLELRSWRPKEWQYQRQHEEEVFEGHDYCVITVACIPTRNLDVGALYPRMIELQGTRRAGLKAVFINMLKNSPMAPNTISKLVATAMRDAGIGPEYTPKSISHAVTTAQRNGGVSTEAICAGRWLPGSTVFETHYTIRDDDGKVPSDDDDSSADSANEAAVATYLNTAAAALTTLTN